MLKRISCLALCLILISGISVQQVVAAGNEIDVSTAIVPPPVEIQDTELTAPALFVNGAVVKNSSLIYRNDIPYVSLRFASLAFCPDAIVTWTGEHAFISDDDLSVIVDPDLNYVIANDRYLYMPEGVIHENGVLCVPVQIVAKIFDAEYSVDPISLDISLTGGSGPLIHANEFYDKDDLYWLSHIIHAESGNQPLEGKIAVGNVVLNRVADPIFPNSIYSVIHQKNQFSPVKNGTIKLTPNEESVLAAKLCLDGAVVLPTALWFNSVKSNSWASRHKTYITTIGGHAFYV